MNEVRDILATPYIIRGQVIRKKWTEDVEGNAAGVVFDDNGTEVLILMTEMYTSLKSNSIRFIFEELEKDSLGIWRSQGEKLIRSTNSKVIDLMTGLSHKINVSTHYENGVLKSNFKLEFNYHIDTFAKIANSPFSVYDNVRQYIKIRFQNGVNQDRVISS